MQKQTEPTYEMEIELCDPIAYLRPPAHTNSHTSASILMKVCDFLGHTGPAFYLEPVGPMRGSAYVEWPPADRKRSLPEEDEGTAGGSPRKAS